MDVPQSVTEKLGTSGVAVYKQGHKDGKQEGQKMSKDKFSIEVNSLGNQVVNGKAKDGYTAPSLVDVGKKAQSTFAIGKTPTRNDLKALALTTLKAMEGLPIPEKKPQPKPASS